MRLVVQWRCRFGSVANLSTFIGEGTIQDRYWSRIFVDWETESKIGFKNEKFQFLFQLFLSQFHTYALLFITIVYAHSVVSVF